MGNVTRDYIPSSEEQHEGAARVSNASQGQLFPYTNQPGAVGPPGPPGPVGPSGRAFPPHLADAMLEKLDRIILLLETLVADPQLIKDQALLRRLAGEDDGR